MIALRSVTGLFSSAIVVFMPWGAAAQTVPATAQLKSPFSGFCAKALDGSTTSGAKIKQVACADGARQLWDFRPDAGGYQIVSKNSNLCLAIGGGSVQQGASAAQKTCTGGESQRWTVRAAGAAVNLRNVKSGQCLEISGASTESGATLSQRNCAAGAAQQTWSLVSAVPSVAIIVNAKSGKCVDMPGGSRSNGTQAALYDCVGAIEDDWILRPVQPIGYQIVNRNSNLCLNVDRGSTANGAAAIQWPCGSPAAGNERWTLRQTARGAQIIAAHSGRCLAVSGGDTTNGSNLVQWDCDGGVHKKWALLSAPEVSKWSQKYPLSLVPVSASALRNGKVLTWSAYDRLSFGTPGRVYTTIFDPATGTATEKLVSNTGQDMFCSGTSTLPDGRILVNGGNDTQKTSIYDPATNAWTVGPLMNIGRGYEANTVLSTGEVLTVGGSWSGGEGGKIAEAWSPTTGAWRRMPGVVAEKLSTPDPQGVFRGDNHMWLFGIANGYAFHAGPSVAMHWISTTGNGAITNAGNRSDDSSSINGNVVMYDAGKILKIGGAKAYQYALATNAAYTIDFSRGPTEPVRVAKQKPMAFPRAFANAVVLPNGQVVVHGGQSYPVPFGDDDSITIPEIWTPSTGAFTPLARTATPRNYHSIAQLLLDGRVLVGGGGLCGDGCGTNHPDVEILTPPYLLNADGSAAARPTIQAAPTTAGLGALISVTTAGPASSFAIVRLSATTHSVNNDQRRLSLPVESTSGKTYGLRLPSDRGTLIAGDWMLFAMTERGTPSVAKVIRVQ